MRHIEYQPGTHYIYFKYIEVPEVFTITRTDNASSVTFEQGKTFVIDIIDQMETSLGVDIFLNSNDDPDTLEFNIQPNQPAALVFGYDLRNGPTAEITNLFDGDTNYIQNNNGFTTEVTQNTTFMQKLIQLFLPVVLEKALV